MSNYELNKYYVPADDDIVIESYKDQDIYEHNSFVTNGVITVSKNFFPNLICSKNSIELPEILSVREFFNTIISDEKCHEIIEKFNTMEKCDIGYKNKTMYHTKKRQDILINSKYSEYLDMVCVCMMPKLNDLCF